MTHDDPVTTTLTRGAEGLRFDADAELERLLRSRSRRVAVRRARTIAAALVVALLGVSVAWIARPGTGAGVTPAGTEPTGSIAYMQVRNGGEHAEVGVLSVGDGSTHPVPVGPFDAYPVWSPDGSRVALGSGPNYDETSLTIANADGSDAQVLVDHQLKGTMSWSPDGTKIAYIRDDDQGYTALFVADVDGSTDREILPGWWQSVSWNPDGSRLLICGHPETTDHTYSEEDYDIYTVTPDGSDLAPLLHEPGYEHFAAWSPDGTEILFARSPSYDDAAYRSDVFVIDADGSHERQLTSYDGFDSFPVWSPDGQWIAFGTDRDSTPGEQQANRQDDAFANISIDVMRADGSDLRPLITAAEGETLLPGSWTW